MKHKHCDVIKAWADGAQIQTRMSVDEKWIAWPRQDISPCFHSDVEYRVKPEKKQLWVRLCRNTSNGGVFTWSCSSNRKDVWFLADGFEFVTEPICIEYDE